MFNFIRNLFKTKQQKEVEKVAQLIINEQNDLLVEIIKDMGKARFNVPEETFLRLNPGDTLHMKGTMITNKSDKPMYVGKNKEPVFNLPENAIVETGPGLFLPASDLTKRRKHPRYSEPEPNCASGYSEGDSND